MARPLLDIDPEQVEKLAALHCTNEEIAAFFDCSADTIERRFTPEILKGKAKGRMKLRREQWKAAERGNVVMLIWLGKQYLDQRDKPVDETDGALIAKGKRLVLAYQIDDKELVK